VERQNVQSQRQASTEPYNQAKALDVTEAKERNPVNVIVWPPDDQDYHELTSFIGLREQTSTFQGRNEANETQEIARSSHLHKLRPKRSVPAVIQHHNGQEAIRAEKQSKDRLRRRVRVGRRGTHPRMVPTAFNRDVQPELRSVQAIFNRQHLPAILNVVR
jgi:hypothetical protein